MVSQLNNLYGENKKNWKLDLLITSPKFSARGIDAGGPLKEGDIIHLLQSDYWRPEKEALVMRFTVLSIDLLQRKSWGPHYCGKYWNPMLQNYEASDLIHIHAFRKKVMGDPDLKNNRYSQVKLTNFITGLPFEEWKIVWDILNELRIERIVNRIKFPREERGQKFDDDFIDIFLSRIIFRVNAILNEELYWGIPADNHHYLLFHNTERRLAELRADVESRK